jgi:hypothetical protein
LDAALSGAAAIGLDNEPVRHVGGGADHATGSRVEGSGSRRGNRVPVRDHVSIGQPRDGFILGVRRQAGGHAGRQEDVLPQVRVKRLAAEHFDQAGRDLVVRVVVVELRARRGDETR